MIKVELTNHMKLTHVSDKQREKIIDDLTFTNPAYENAVKFSRYQHVSIPKNITYYFDEEGELWVPRGYSIPFDYEIVKDERIDVNVDYPKFRVKLWGTQREAVLAYLRRDNSRDGVIVMPTGKGKSVTAIYLASHLKQKTLVIVQKDDLIDGWKQDIKRCLGLRPVEIGLIKGKAFRIGDRITLCTIQTLSKLDEEAFDSLTTNFGLIVLDECFPKGTKISGRNIEDLKVGDIVESYNEIENKVEYKKIIKVFKSKPHCIINIKLSNGKEIVCTAGHPFYDGENYIPAMQLKKNDELYFLWETDNNSFNKTPEIQIQKNRKSILFFRMFKGVFQKNIKRNHDKNKQEICFRKNERKQSYEEGRSERKSIFSKKGKRNAYKDSWRKWNSFTRSTSKINSSINAIFSRIRICYKNITEKNKWLSSLLQSRYWISEISNSNRDRWAITQCYKKKNAGCKERGIFEKIRVESVTFQEQTSDGTFGGVCPDGYVYNIEVEDNHNYFANGILVHNCHHAAAQSYDIVSCFYARHKIALTATPYRSDNLDDVLFLYFGGIVFEYEEQEEDDDIIAAKNVNIKTVSVPEAYYNPERTYYSSRLKKYLKVSEFYQYLPENIKKNPDARKSVFLKRLIDQKFFGECKLQPLSIDEIRKAIIYNDFFVNKVVGDVQAAFAFGKSIVVFCHEKEQCRLIHRRLEMIGIPLSRMQLFYGDSKISKEETKRKAESKEVLITIATFSIATEGTNIRPWESAFFAGTIANKKDLIQCIGRLRRKYPGKERVTIFDYDFPNVASARNHQNFRLKIYNEIGFNVR